MLLAADESIELWAAGGLDFDELAADIAGEVRLLRHLNAEIASMDDRIEALYDESDPKGIVVSTPGIGVTLGRDPRPARRPGPLRQPGRRAVVHRPGAQDRPVGAGEPPQGRDQGGRSRAT